MQQNYQIIEIAKAIGGKMNKTANGIAHNTVFDISIDSRDIEKNQVFWAIKGQNYDGHDFVEKAFEKNAALAIVTEEFCKQNIIKHKPIIFVKDTLKALEKLAVYSRSKTKAKILAITGSAGKTTVKEMVYHALGEKNKVFSAKKSYNNHIGVPLSLVNMNKNAKHAIFEIGTNKPGEIQKLANMIKPHIAVVTCIEPSHIGNFNSMQELAREKASIFFSMNDQGIAIFLGEGKFAIYLKNTVIKAGVGGIFRFGKEKQNEVQVVHIKEQTQSQEIKIKIIDQEYNLKLSTPGIQYAHCALIAVCALYLLEDDIENALENLTSFVPIKGRGKIHEIKKHNITYTIIDDSYNANPASMKCSLQRFAKIAKNAKRRVAVLGQMLELGKKEKIYHMDLEKNIKNAKIDKLFLVGENFEELAQKMKKQENEQFAVYHDNWQEIEKKLHQNILDQDYILLKGSNRSGVCNLAQNFIRQTQK